MTSNVPGDGAIPSERADSPPQWPGWLTEQTANLADSVARIASAHAVIHLEAHKGLRYRHAFQRQLNAFQDEWFKSGRLSRGQNGEVVLQDGAVSQMSRAHVAGHIANNASLCRMWDVIFFRTTASLDAILEGARRGLAEGDLFIPLICFRSVIENVAHLHETLHKLGEVQVPAEFEGANQELGRVMILLEKRGYATRFDWRRVIDEGVHEPIAAGKTEYRPAENRTDVAAESVLKSIDRLGKTLKGTRGIYELLCEFAHPNVGALIAFTKSVRPAGVDANGVLWIEKELGRGVPRPFLEETPQFAEVVFDQVAACAEHHVTLMRRHDELRPKLLELSQTVIRRLVQRSSGLFPPYEPCPCESGKKFKFCCGDLKSHTSESGYT